MGIEKLNNPLSSIYWGRNRLIERHKAASPDEERSKASKKHNRRRSKAPGGTRASEGGYTSINDSVQDSVANHSNQQYEKDSTLVMNRSLQNQTIQKGFVYCQCKYKHPNRSQKTE